MFKKKNELVNAAACVVDMYDQAMTGKKPTSSRDVLLQKAIDGLRSMLGDWVILPKKD